MKNTFINQIRVQALSQKEQVMSALQWSDLQYAEYQEQMGYLYLKSEFGSDSLYVAELPYSPEFWAWWKNHWSKRDQLFLMDAYKLDLSERLTLYSQLHNPYEFHFRPHSKVLEKTYSCMISRVIKEATK